MSTEPLTVEAAARNVQLAKRTENLANEARIRAENDLLALLTPKTEGSVTTSTDGYKVTVTYGFNRTVDEAALNAIKDEIPTGLFDQVINYKPSLILAGLRHIQSNEPDTYAVLAQAITSKPAKPSVKVEAIEPLQEAA
jgi:hypothetical protein